MATAESRRGFTGVESTDRRETVTTKRMIYYYFGSKEGSPPRHRGSVRQGPITGAGHRRRRDDARCGLAAARGVHVRSPHVT